MAWLAALDARASRWPKPLRAFYLGAKWYLVIGGAIILINLLGDRLGFWSIF